MRPRTLLPLLLLAAACGRRGSADEQAAAAPPSGSASASAASGGAGATGTPAATAREIFQLRCTPCHGPSGAGDGPASAGLNPKPRRFSDREWQSSVDDEHLMKVIKFGGAAVGKSPAMPGNPDLNDPAVLGALKDVVRGFGR